MTHVRMKGFKKTTKAEEALERFVERLAIVQLESELVSVDQALNRILAKDIVSNVNIPAFDRAAMDGYAVVAEDTFGSSQTEPALLRLVGKALMGVLPTVKISRKEAAEITTGAMLPPRADAVVMLEYVMRSEAEQIEVMGAVTPGENVSKTGEDVQKGEIVLRRGTRLRPSDIGMLAALMLSEVDVFRRPRVAMLCTGSELVELGDSLQEGKVVNTNRYVLSALVREVGGTPTYLGIAEDTVADISRLLSEGLAGADVVLVTGGTSVGETDLVPEAIQMLGKPGMLVHGVSMRPGMPTGLASIDGRPVISLSGNPVAAIIGFDMFVRPVILRLLGAEEETPPSVKAKILRRAASALGMKTFLRVIVNEIDGEYVAEPITATGSGLLSSLTRANGIVVIPEDKEGLEAGEEVVVKLFRPVERRSRD